MLSKRPECAIDAPQPFSFICDAVILIGSVILLIPFLIVIYSGRIVR